MRTSSITTTLLNFPLSIFLIPKLSSRLSQPSNYCLILFVIRWFRIFRDQIESAFYVTRQMRTDGVDKIVPKFDFGAIRQFGLRYFAKLANFPHFFRVLAFVKMAARRTLIAGTRRICSVQFARSR